MLFCRSHFVRVIGVAVAASGAFSACKSRLNSVGLDEAVVSSQDSSSLVRFLGFVHLSDQHRMAVAIDVIPASSNSYSGLVVRFLPGGFASPESSSFYFPDIDLSQRPGGRYESESAAHGGGGGLSLEGASALAERFSSKVSFQVNGVSKTGYIDARRVPASKVEISAFEGSLRSLAGNSAILGGIAGQYQASCNDLPTAVQLEFSRWGSQSLPQSTGFLRDGLITGRIGVVDAAICREKPLSCSQQVIRGGSYDPFSGQVTLNGVNRNFNCQLNADDLTCDACRLGRVPVASDPGESRDSFMNLYERAPETLFQVGSEVDLVASPAALESGYYGYLHHESTGLYQPVSLNLSFDAGTGRYLPVSAVYFGSVDRNEFIAYRFEPVSIPVLRRGILLDGGGEALFFITNLGDRGINGIWFSKTHGRIGTISLVRGKMPPLMADEKLLMPSLSGHYAGENWRFDLSVASNVSEDAREFYPLRMFGAAREVADPTKRRLIQDGSFDFYTGQLAFRLDDGRTIVGTVSATGLQLFWPAWTRHGAMTGNRELQAFKRSDNSERTLASRKFSGESTP
jgi:hypothetical protein